MTSVPSSVTSEQRPVDLCLCVLNLSVQQFPLPHCWHFFLDCSYKMVSLYYHLGPEGLRLFLFEIDLFISEVTGRGLIEGIVVCLLSVPVIVALNKVDKAPQNVVRKTFIFITILPVDMLILFLSCSL